MGGEIDGDDDYTNLPGNLLKDPLYGAIWKSQFQNGTRFILIGRNFSIQAYRDNLQMQ